MECRVATTFDWEWGPSSCNAQALRVYIYIYLSNLQRDRKLEAGILEETSSVASWKYVSIFFFVVCFAADEQNPWKWPVLRVHRVHGPRTWLVPMQWCVHVRQDSGCQGSNNKTAMKRCKGEMVAHGSQLRPPYIPTASKSCSRFVVSGPSKKLFCLQFHST